MIHRNLPIRLAKNRFKEDKISEKIEFNKLLKCVSSQFNKNRRNAIVSLESNAGRLKKLSRDDEYDKSELNNLENIYNRIVLKKFDRNYINKVTDLLYKNSGDYNRRRKELKEKCLNDNDQNRTTLFPTSVKKVRVHSTSDIYYHNHKPLDELPIVKPSKDYLPDLELIDVRELMKKKNSSFNDKGKIFEELSQKYNFFKGKQSKNSKSLFTPLLPSSLFLKRAASTLSKDYSKYDAKEMFFRKMKRKDKTLF